MTTPPAPTAYDALCARHAPAAARLLEVLLPLEQSVGRDLSVPLARAEAELRPAYDTGEVTEASFRPHLLAAVRHQVEPVSVADAAAEPAVAQAWAALSPAAQGTLWLGEVEGWSEPELRVALDPASLAEPAAAHRELADALLAATAEDARRAGCAQVRGDLPAYLRGELTGSHALRVSAHLECCRRCSAVARDLAAALGDVTALLAPVVLGRAAAGYLAALPVPHEPTAKERLAAFAAGRAGRALLGTAAAIVLVAGLGMGTGLAGGSGSGGSGGSGAADSAVADAPVAEVPVATPPVTAPTTPRSPAATPSGRPHATAAAVRRPGPSATPSSISDGDAADDTPVIASATPSQSPTPTSTPTRTPTRTPTHTPTHTPPTHTHTPTTHPTTPTQVPTVSTVSQVSDPSAVDMAVTAAGSGGALASVVTVGWSGLADDQPGVVTLRSDALGATVSLDPRCTLLGVGTATCRVSGAGSLKLVAASLPLGSSTLTVSGEPADGLWDPAPGDNTARVVLGSRV